MGGPSKQDKQAQRDISAQELAMGRELAALGREQMAQQKEYQAPLANLLKLITGGDRALATQTMAPAISEISRGTEASKEAILEQVPAGAGRDFALAQAEGGRASQVSNLMNKTWLDAFQQLAGLGQGAAQIGLNAYGGGFRGMEAGSNTINSVMQADAASRAATFGLIGSLAQAGGQMLGGSKWMGGGKVGG